MKLLTLLLNFRSVCLPRRLPPPRLRPRPRPTVSTAPMVDLVHTDTSAPTTDTGPPTLATLPTTPTLILLAAHMLTTSVKPRLSPTTTTDLSTPGPQDMDPSTPGPPATLTSTSAGPSPPTPPAATTTRPSQLRRP
jgi:hypothetical protein